MPTRDVQIWGGRVSDNVHDASSQAASELARNSSPTGHKSSSTSSATSTTTDSTERSSGSTSRRRVNNCRKFPFSSGSMEIKTPPPPPAPSRAVVTTVDVKRNSIFPVGWLLGTIVSDVCNALSQWILEGISAWLLQRSFLGNVHRQVFRDLRHRMKAGPLSILVTPPPMDEEVPRKKTILSVRESRIHKQKTVKLLDEPDTDLLVMSGAAGAGGGGMTDAVVTPEEPTAADEGGSHTVQWVIFAIEVMALIPIVVIGLSLFYILAVGIYNDLQDLLRRLFGEDDSGNSQGPNPTSGEF